MKIGDFFCSPMKLLFSFLIFTPFLVLGQDLDLQGYWIPCYTQDSCVEKKHTAYVCFTEDEMQSAIFMSGPDKDPSKFGYVGHYVIKENVLEVSSEKDAQIDRYKIEIYEDRLILIYLPVGTKIYFKRATLVK